MYKYGPRTERIKIFMLVVDPLHRYSNESEVPNFIVISNWKILFVLHGL